MITYAQAAEALRIMENATNEGRPKAKVVAIDELQPMNRKQRRIQASKDRRNGKSKGLR